VGDSPGNARNNIARVLKSSARLSSDYGCLGVLSLRVNGSVHVCRNASATVADLVRELALEGKRVAVERNGEIVPKSAHALTLLAAGDRIEVVAAVGGG
jgi:sulfur carrier protein